MDLPMVDQAMRAALQHHQAGRLAEAQVIYRQLLAQHPNHAPALHLLGVLAGQKGRPDIAVDLITRAITLCPTDSDYYSNLSKFLGDQGHHDRAVAACRQALALAPQNVPVLYNLAVALVQINLLDEAIACYRQVLALQPRHPQAANNLAGALAQTGRPDEAIHWYRRSLEDDPNNAATCFNLGIILLDQGRLDEAHAACTRAITLNPSHGAAHNNLANVLKEQGDIEQALAHYQRAMEIQPQEPIFHSNFAYVLHFHPDYGASSLLQEHRLWGHRHAAPLQKFIPQHSNDPGPNRPLRIGYISPDFRDHVVARFMLPLLAAHSPLEVEAFCYADVKTPDAMSRQLMRHVRHWRNIAGLNDQTVSQMILNDRIDILVDLAAHMAQNRLLVFARKPAPIQVTYLAYCSTTGLSAMDYRLTDPYLDPPGSDESVYSERSIRLPRTYWCYDQSQPTPEVNALPALQTRRITFGCLNNFCKVSSQALEVWAALLQTLPDARLLLHAHPGIHRQRATNLFTRKGLDPNRCAFVGRAPIAGYFQQYHQIDIALDPFPYAGGTTTCDALWMGVPVVTLRGPTAVGRAGASILSSAGLPELIAADAGDYIRIAAALAGDLPRLADLRANLRARMMASPLMDAPAFARDMEVAYRQMWHHWCTRQSPTQSLPQP